MSEATRTDGTVRVGRVVLDFGTHHREAAWQSEQALPKTQVTLTVDEEPA
jgi:hypothetical protein